MAKIFVICSVRDASDEFLKTMQKYVDELEKEGHEVHFPPRDTDQSDSRGYTICSTNMRAIYEADEVHIHYGSDSAGSHFDLGGLFMLVEIVGQDKKVVLINGGLVETEERWGKPGKSFLKVTEDLVEKTGGRLLLPSSPPGWRSPFSRQN